ncbi:MAG: Maf family nucleotide pyrophosphatase [Bdellovibrionales bacterium]|nr:Maf family nucleotide pyrophosphatase [Bdellovibrionales bacterium]
MKIVLASQSPGRKLLLKRTGIPFETLAPSIDEEACFKEIKNPTESICLHIARKKAEKIFSEKPEAVIIASDQMAFFEERFYGKAYNTEKAIQTLSLFQGKTHQLINGLYMKYKDKSFSRITINKMSLRPLSLNQIKAYVQRDQPLHSAGCYYIDQTGLSLFEKIESEDFSSIIGLPIMAVVNQLIKWGYPYLQK